MTHHDEIIKRNTNMVYRLAYAQMKNKNDADDVFQDVFYRYLKKQPVFESAEHEKAWFIRVTLNCSKTNLTSFWRTRVCELDDSFEAQAVETQELKWALKKLPKKYSAVIHLFYYEDMSIKDISTCLGISEGNTGVILSRGRKMLKQILIKENAV